MMESIIELVEKAAEKFGDKTYLYFGDQEISFREINRISNLAASAFQDEGIRKGDRIAIMVPNLPEFLYLWFGINKIGAIIVPINTELTAFEIEYQLNHSGAVMVATDKNRLNKIQNACKKSSVTGRVIIVDDVGENKDCVSFSSFISGCQESFVPVEIDPGTEAAILYTSGTTGRPKGCTADQFYYLNAGIILAREHLMQFDDRILTPLPLFHMNAQLTAISALTIGSSMILLDRFHPSAWWKTIREKQVTFFHYLGVIPAMLIGLPDSPYDYSLRTIYGIGAGCPRDIQAKFEKRFNVELLEVYGSTEVAAGACFMMGRRRHSDRKVGTGSFGTPLPEGEAKVVDDNDQDVPVGTIGELILRSADPQNRRKGLMRGYYNDPEATEQAWKNGWFHTGDFCVQDDENYFYFVDRKKDMVRRSGENIAATEVETVIRLFPDVADVAVVPVPDSQRVEEVFAFIVPRKETLNPEEVIAWCEEKMAYFKIPRYIRFRKDLPKTSTQKVQKMALKEEAKKGLKDSWDRTIHYKLKRDRKKSI